MSLARAREHYDQLKRRAPGSDVHTRLLLGALLDELERQAALIERLNTPQPCTRCAQRDEWARGSKVGESAPYTGRLPWLGTTTDTGASNA